MAPTKGYFVDLKNGYAAFFATYAEATAYEIYLHFCTREGLNEYLIRGGATNLSMIDAYATANAVEFVLSDMRAALALSSSNPRPIIPHHIHRLTRYETKE